MVAEKLLYMNDLPFLCLISSDYSCSKQPFGAGRGTYQCRKNSKNKKYLMLFNLLFNKTILKKCKKIRKNCPKLLAGSKNVVYFLNEHKESA